MTPKHPTETQQHQPDTGDLKASQRPTGTPPPTPTPSNATPPQALFTPRGAHPGVPIVAQWSVPGQHLEDLTTAAMLN